MKCEEITHKILAISAIPLSRGLGAFDALTLRLAEKTKIILNLAEISYELPGYRAGIDHRNFLAQACGFRRIDTFACDRAWARKAGEEADFLIDPEGESLGRFSNLSQRDPFIDGSAIVFADRNSDLDSPGWALIGLDGEYIIPPGRYSSMLPSEQPDGLIMASRHKGGCDYLRRDGSVALHFDNTNIDQSTCFARNVAWLEDDRKFFQINEKGETLTELQSEGNYFQGFSEGMAWFYNSRSNKICLYNEKGDKVTEFSGRLEHDVFHEGIARVYCGASLEDFPPGVVSKHSGFFYINRYGRPISSSVYREASEFSCGRAKVHFAGSSLDDRRYIYIGRDGTYRSRLVYLAAETFSEDAAVVKNKHGSFFINLDGEELFPGKYFDHCFPFRDGVALVTKSGRHFYIDKFGRRIF